MERTATIGILAAGALAASLAVPGAAAAAGAAPAVGVAEAVTSSPGEAAAQTTPAAPAPGGQAAAEGSATQTTSTPAPAPQPPSGGGVAVSRSFHQRPSSAGPPSPRRAAAAPLPGASGGASPSSSRAAAPAPGALTPSLPLELGLELTGVPSFFIESFGVPPFLLPIFQAAGTAYDVPWQVLAAINEVETDYGRDLSVSSAGAEGWMQFLPSEWAQYGVDANGDGWKDPYNPADAIFAAARYLRAAGGASDIRAAVLAYNHSPAYVDSVMLRAQLLGGIPAELLGAITALTEARFPVHAVAHYSDGFPSLTSGSSTTTLAGTRIYAASGAPVIAVQDGKVVQIGSSPTLGHFVVLRDAYGNTYTYGRLGSVASLYPVLQPDVSSAISPRLHSQTAAEPAPSGPASAGVQPRSPVSEAGTVSGLTFGAAAALEAAPAPAPAATTHVVQPPGRVRVFRAGVNDVYLHPLRSGVQVLAGTVLGHVGAEASVLFQIRPAGSAAPQIDPKPILDGWVALENSSIFRARGVNPFLATSPSVGQVLLESAQQLAPQVLRDGGISLGRCGREDVQEGRVDRRVLAMLEYLSVSGLRPSVTGMACPPSTAAALAANGAAAGAITAIRISAVDGVAVAGHDGPGTPAAAAVRRLLEMQGFTRPQRIVTDSADPGDRIVVTRPGVRTIGVAYPAPRPAGARIAAGSGSALSPSDWVRLVARLGEIPDPAVPAARSGAAIPDRAGSEGATGGHH